MRMAVSTLTMLNTLVGNEAVRAGFMAEEVAARAAGAVSGRGSETGFAWPFWLALMPAWLARLK